MLFWLNGVAWSSILPRYPEIKESLRLDDQWWGIAVAIGPVGGLVAGLVDGRVDPAVLVGVGVGGLAGGGGSPC